MNNNNFYKIKFLQKIILTSFLSSFSIILNKFSYLNFIKLKIMNYSFNNYIKFLPIIILSFYVSFILSFIGAFLSEMLGFMMSKSAVYYNYNPFTSLICAIVFGILPGLILKKEDKNLKFFICFLFIFSLYQFLHTLSFLFFNIMYLQEKSINIYISYLLNKKKEIFLWKFSGIIITSFVATIITKKIIKNLSFF